MRNDTSLTQLGVVTEVHILKNKREVYVTVECGPSDTYPGIPFYSGNKNMWNPPREGDEVEVYWVGKNKYAARKPKFPPVQRQRGWQAENDADIQRPRDLIEDDICLRFEDGSEFFIRREKQGGEEVRSLYVRMSGDITFEAQGDINEFAGTDPDSRPEYYPEDRKRKDFE